MNKLYFLARENDLQSIQPLRCTESSVHPPISGEIRRWPWTRLQGTTRQKLLDHFQSIRCIGGGRGLKALKLDVTAILKL